MHCTWGDVLGWEQRQGHQLSQEVERVAVVKVSSAQAKFLRLPPNGLSPVECAALAMDVRYNFRSRTPRSSLEVHNEFLYRWWTRQNVKDSLQHSLVVFCAASRHQTEEKWHLMFKALSHRMDIQCFTFTTAVATSQDSIGWKRCVDQRP